MLMLAVFGTFDEGDRAMMRDHARVSALKNGEVLIHANQHCSVLPVVVSGKLRVETPMDGGDKTFLTGFLEANQLYIEKITHDGYFSSNTLRATGNCVVQTIPLFLARELLLKNPEVIGRLFEESVQRSQQLRRQLRRLKMDPVRVQVARAAYDAAETLRDGRRVLDRQITQSDLAATTGLSREVVNKELKLLGDAELLVKSEQGLVLDPRLAQTNFHEFPENGPKHSSRK